ncbi:MAG: hypothetical protein JJE04_15870, partial [Acidobacteriia bacterium]|nr:hypothetical protein [Terriglobia bacterium]
TFPEASWKLELSHVSARVLEGPPIEIAYRRVLEARIPLSLAAAPVGVEQGGKTRLRISLWQGSLPLDALPPDGWIELLSAEAGDWPI